MDARARGRAPFDLLEAGQLRELLRRLLDIYPEARGDAARIANLLAGAVDEEAVASRVEASVASLETATLWGRSGRQPWGYVHASEAAWEMLEEAVRPHMDRMLGRLEKGRPAEAAAYARGIIRGLHRLRGPEPRTDTVLGNVPEFPGEHAYYVAGRLLEGLAGTEDIDPFPDSFLDEVTGWEELPERASA